MSNAEMMERQALAHGKLTFPAKQEMFFIACVRDIQGYPAEWLTQDYATYRGPLEAIRAARSDFEKRFNVQPDRLILTDAQARAFVKHNDVKIMRQTRILSQRPLPKWIELNDEDKTEMPSRVYGMRIEIHE